jgi:Ca2+-binding EF-hand superfamily protein
VDSLWRKYDRNGNGSIDKAEAFRMVKETFSVGDNDSFNQVWALLDKDRSGDIS